MKKDSYKIAMRVNSVIWSIAPKTTFCGKKIVDIAICIAVSTFNDGYNNILLIMQTLNFAIGSQTFDYCKRMNERRINHAKINRT